MSDRLHPVALAGRTGFTGPYQVSGDVAIPLDRLIDEAAAACWRRVAKLHLPLGPVAWLLGAIQAVGIRPRIQQEQVLRLAEDKAFSHDDATRDLGHVTRPFAQGVREEARALGRVPS